MSVLPSPSIQLARSLATVPLDEIPQMSAVDLLKKQLDSGSTEAAVDAVKRLGIVAAAIGPADTVRQLLPYLAQFVQQQPVPVDELLLILGQQCPAIATVAGGTVLVEFLPLIERLAAVEETVVRDQAVTVYNELSRRFMMSSATVVSQPPSSSSASAASPPPLDTAPWMAMVKRLAAADWFTAKVSAAGMIAATLQLLQAVHGPAAEGHQLELLQLYRELSSDETPMVRRAAAKHLGPVLQQAGWTLAIKAGTAAAAAAEPVSATAGPTTTAPGFVPCFANTQTVTALCRDEQDSVRLLAIASLAQAGATYGEHPAWTVQYWLPLLKDASTDLSWRVRHNLAKHFSDVAYTLGIDYKSPQGPRYVNEQSLVMACFVALLTDAEAEVRASAVGHLARMVAWGGPQHFAAHLQPLLAVLADDVVMEVRSKCALALMDAAHGGSLDDAVILQAFGPLLESFLQDEFQEVQLQVLTNLHKIAHLLSGLSGVVTSLMQMSKASNWRVREAIAQLLPHLAEARGLDFFQTVLLEPAWLTLLLDPVARVRTTLVQGMGLLLQVAGEEWIMSTLLPHLLRIASANGGGAHPSYLIRITVLHSLIETAIAAAKAGSQAAQVFPEVVMQIVRCLTQDKVANVRMVAAKGLGRVIMALDPSNTTSSSGSVGATTPLSPSSSTSGVGSDGGAAAALMQTQVRPALEKRLMQGEEDDVDCRWVCQQTLDLLK